MNEPAAAQAGYAAEADTAADSDAGNGGAAASDSADGSANSQPRSKFGLRLAQLTALLAEDS